MNYSTRILPSDEWPKLHEAGLVDALQYFDPANVQMVVVEDGAAIVGAWAVVKIVHVEGLWIAPAYRHGSVARRLMTATLKVAQHWTPRWVMTMAQTDEVKGLLQHVGAVHIPGETYVFPVTRG